jgi:Zn-dependent alcohol dehydrogenase
VEWLNTIQGCLIAGTRMIVAVDTNESKLELARRFGATHTVNAKSEEGVTKTVKKSPRAAPTTDSSASASAKRLLWSRF